MLSKFKITIAKTTKQIMLLGGLLCCLSSKAQIVNYVNNGGFEDAYPGISQYQWDGFKFWDTFDSTKIGYYTCSTSASYSNAPYVSTGFQYPRHGNNFIGTQFYCGGLSCNSTNSREYPRNRLKQQLKPNTRYCAKYFVVNTNNNVVAISNFGIHIGDMSLDTIKYCNANINYLPPQIENNQGIITDTLNWTAITGTFTASGNEKYLVIGNFRSNVNTNTLLINPPNSLLTNDIYIDDVSLIDLDLPAFAGRDTFFIPGDSIYLGRPSDVGIDEACMWYKLPNTTTAIDTVAGLWVKPVTTTTYVVKQDICGNIKWDTVVLYQSAIGVHELDLISNNLKIYPQPATNVVNIQLNLQMDAPFNKYQLYNNLGQLIREEELSFKNHIATITFEDLANGVYFISISNLQNETITKKLVIAK
ncbi:MAG: T9SS type A sorting domain-containing protein [Bacteroidia bacterium]|nr:T9SS type A sorting domain-containing protein [Bacteroidia bacterium]